MNAPGPSERIKAALWRRAFSRWHGDRIAKTPGYTLALPVPADLPVFLRLALATAASQRAEHRVETLVVPDVPSPAFRDELEAASAASGVADARLVEPGRAAQLMRRAAGNAISSNHFVQLYTALDAARGTHVVLHDADLFIRDAAFLDERFRQAREAGVACLGVQPAWDDWLREHDLAHVAATWELMVTAEWAYSFPPWQHRPRADSLDGERHVFDTMLYTQALTPPERCAVREPGDAFAHFNWVIGVYRNFQNSSGPFEDDRFLLVLIRLLSEEFGTSPGAVPPIAEMARGIGDAQARVTYVHPHTPRKYKEFRRTLARALEAPVFGADAAARAEVALEPFERAFGEPDQPASGASSS